MGDTGEKIFRIGGVHAGYKFEFRQDGVFLTVYPQTNNEILFELSDMRQILNEYSVDDYDLEALAHAVREAAGLPRFLGKKFILPEGSISEGEENAVKSDSVEYGTIVVDIAKDKMSATVSFEKTGNQITPTADMIMEALADRHVTYGIEQEAVEEAARTGRMTVVAHGTPPQPGTDAVILRKFDIGEKGRPMLDNNNRADYKNLNYFVPVTKGQVLAERIPHTQGVPGTNINGDKINTKNGKPKPIPVGKNTSVQDENLLIADIDGQIVDAGNKISVDSTLEVKEDVGMATGNIEFDGAVHIRGSVQAGFIVKATGDIEVNGMISGAVVEGRNICVKGGVQGMNRGYIKAAEDFKASFAENADIEAGGNIYISDVAMHSNIRAGHHLAVEGVKGQVTGGDLAAGEEISAKTIGNEANVVTKITVGVNPMLQKEYQEILKTFNEDKKRLDQLVKTRNTLSKIDTSQLPPEKVEMLNALKRQHFLLAGKVERNEKKLKEIDIELQKLRNGRVRVSDKMYPGVRLSIDSIRKNLQTEEVHCTQYVKDDFIVVGPY